MNKRGARLGQHFLTHAWAAKKLAYAAAPKEGETILEIGPGKGVLTRELLQLGPVVAVEKDEALVAKLKETFTDEISSGRLTILEGDIRDLIVEAAEVRKSIPDARSGESGNRDVSKDTARVTLRLRNNADGIDLRAGYVLAANIPYYITGEIIRQFLTAEVQPRAMALLVQKEVAQRIVDTKESILSISVKAYGTPKIIAKVGKSHFSPPPSVDSAILLVDDISKEFFRDLPEELFFTVVRAGFAAKRKMLANNLSSVASKEMILSAFAQCGISEKARPENVSIEQWKLVARALQ